MSDPGPHISQCATLRALVPCDLSQVHIFREALHKFLLEQGLQEDEIMACELAAVEACNNAIQNAPEDARHDPVEVTALCNGSKIELRVVDHTPGFEWPENVELPDIEAERGRGIFFIHSLMDHADYLRGRGENSLVMSKQRFSLTHRKTGVAGTLEEAQRRLQESERALGNMAKELSFLSESLLAIFRCSAELGRTNNLEEFTERLLRDLLHITSADWFVLRIIPLEEQRLVLFSSSQNLKAELSLPLVPAGFPGHSVEIEAVMTRRDVWFDYRRPLQASDPLFVLGENSTGLVRPFFSGDTLLGTLTVGRKGAEPFTAAHSEVVHTFADFLAIQVVNARMREEQVTNRLISHELEIARNIQRSLLPKSLPQLPGFGVAGYCQSARQVGGDLYDVLQLTDHSLLLIVADVMGKGVPAALFAAILRTVVRAVPEWIHRPAELLARVNWLMFEELSAVDMFITAQLVFVDARSRLLTVASAGHCPLLVAQAGSKVQSIAPEGMPLGILATTNFLEQTVRLAPGCKVLLCTDGVVEERNSRGEFFGQERLTEWLGRMANEKRTAEELKDALADELGRFKNHAPLKDDQTFILLADDPATIQEQS